MAKSKPNEIAISRIYNAPVKAVWDAWTDLKQVTQWWGPRGFTITTKSKDLKSGGQWIYTMHGPDGVDYPNITTYFEVEKYSRLVYDHGASEGRPPLFRVTVNFEEIKGNKTKMEMTMALATEEVAKETKKFIKKAGGNGTWDRLGEHLEKQISGKEKFIINRSFTVPIEKMFEMWTNPQHFSKWLPPTGFNMEFVKADIRTGGTSLYLMFNDEHKMYGQFHHQEINKPHRIVYTQNFSDEKGNMARHIFEPKWPETMLTVVEFTEESPDETRVTITWEVSGNVTAEEMTIFINEKAGMTEGWTGSFDKLDEYLGIKD